MVIIGAVFGDNRAESAGAQTIDLLYRKKAVRSHFSRLHAENVDRVVDEEMRISHVAGCARAQGKCVFTSWMQTKSFVKRGYSINFDNRNTKTERHDFHRFFKKITIDFLNVLECFNKLVGLAASA